MTGRQVTRRQVLGSAGAAVLLALAAACSRQPAGVPAPDARLRVVTDPADPRVKTFGAAGPPFAVGLLRQVRRRPGNPAVSPHGLGQTLAMLAQGASAATLSQILTTLRVALGQADAAYGANGVAQLLDGLTKTKISTAGALYAAQNLKLQAPFKKALAESFGSSTQPADFDDADGLAERVNGWVSGRTSGRFPTILGADQIEAGTRLLAVNAVYLRALWKVQFDPALTATAPFRLDSKRQVPVAMMTVRTRLNVARTKSGTDAALLLYEDTDLRLLVVAPPLGALETVVAKAKPTTLTDILKLLKPAEVQLRLPRFRARLAADVTGPLQALGMVDAFDGLAADFSAMTGSEVQLGLVQHDAWYTVGERGTESVGEVGPATAAPAPGAAALMIDRPFYFMVFDNRTRTVLFTGLVRDPTLGL